ncbi:MAG: hypothetical protein HZT41_10025 [Dechloromonas sp.]|nr:MAG: hypothetical protein HZT41_10025 [Dechloromonas sp.]
MSNQNVNAHKGEDIPANSAADATMQETSTEPVQFPLVTLPGGFAADAKFMDVIRLLALDHIPLLKPDTAYEAKEIVGAEYWQLLKKSEPLLAGRCMTYLTQNNQLPLVDLGRGTDNHKRYALK